MSMTPSSAVDNLDLLAVVRELERSIRAAADAGRPIHEVERHLWREVLDLGRQFLGWFLQLQGTGDMGETLTLPDGSQHRRLPELHQRHYVSIFGPFELRRTVYGSREGPAITCVPLDQRLQLPDSDFSYVLQDWDQSLCVEQSFAQAKQTIARILGLHQSVDSLETMNGHMAETVESYREDRALPKPEGEGELMVASADGKGIVLRREPGEPASAAHRSKGEKASRKRMATVGAVYSVPRHPRTAEDVVAALSHDEPRPAQDRPRPQGKHVWASLGRVDENGEAVSGMDIVFPWLLDELVARSRRGGLWTKEIVYLYDGQESLWEACLRHLPQARATGILDLLHVTPRLWQATHVFFKEGTAEAETFLRERLLRVLHGEVRAVVGGLRQMGTKRGLTGAKKKTLAKACAYLMKNADRMRYDVYLAKGYPIASGVIEGACRHLVKDRMERAGMHWRERGAQAMLDLRSIYVNAEWEAFQSYRIHRECTRLHPYRKQFAGVNFNMAA